MTTAETPPFEEALRHGGVLLDRAGSISADLWARAREAGGTLAESVGPVLGEAGRTAVPPQTAWIAGAVAVAAVAALLIARRVLRWRRAERPTESLSALTAGPKLFGFTVLGIFVVGLGGWSASAPLASAALAPGVVSPDGDRKTVQHLEGGIVRAILVRDGDVVTAGQPVVVMEDTQARGQYEELRERMVHLLSMEARLIAEQAEADTIARPAEMAALMGAEVERALESQQRLFESRQATRDGRERILGQRVRQLEEEIIGLEEVIAAQEEQLDLVAQEIVGVQQLYDQGLERLPRLLSLQRQQAEIRAERAANRASIARNRQEIGEAEIQLLSLGEQHREEVDEELTKLRAELATLRSRLPSRIDVLSRTAIEAPISGTVMNVRVTTETGVVRPGDDLLEIVPADASLVIDARVRPTDIEELVPGQRARVLLTAYRQRNLPQIFGTLRSVSADRLTDERTGEAYFLAKVEVDPEELSDLGADLHLSPGMPAEVMILTGEQTVLEYIFEPLYRSLLMSFREA